MKKNYFIILLLALALKSFALVPKTSTESNPLWYYLQVEGSGNNREGMVFTVEGNFICGKQIEFVDKIEIDKQLFRFEMAADNNYYIISKVGNKKVDVVYSSNERRLALNDEGCAFSITLVPNTNYYNMEMIKSMSEGNTSAKWVHQSNSGSPFAVILTTTSYYRGYNSQYAFVPYDEVHLQYSGDENDVFYLIKSANPEYSDRYITDISMSGNLVHFAIETKDTNNKAQQWKIIKKDAVNSNCDFVNRATGNIIQTKSELGDFYNYVQFTQSNSESNGWHLSYQKAGQYAIFGSEEDDITRYWTFTEEGKEPEKYEGGKITFTNFAWKLEKAEEVSTRNDEVKITDDLVVSVRDRRIFVAGYDKYSVRTIQGVLVNNKNQLPIGIYIVSAGQQNVKIFVK